jgi:dTDP-4-dehydrorhamnose reductase
MKVLITGSGGQLGRALQACAPADVLVVALDRGQLDLADAAAIDRTIALHRPQVVINAGAYTAVDRAESERATAFAVNGVAPGLLAHGCRAHGARLVHVSTDYVFDGTKGVPYLPGDAPAPRSVYGESKLEGERRVADVAGLDWFIVRTAWVYDSSSRNFLTTMLRLFRERGEVGVVADQVGTPTSAASLARVLWRLAADRGPPATLHYTNAGVASWYDFAAAIHDEARALGLVGRDVTVRAISTEQYPTPARRPAYSVLEKRAALERLALSPIHWRVELRAVMRELIQ